MTKPILAGDLSGVKLYLRYRLNPSAGYIIENIDAIDCLSEDQRAMSLAIAMHEAKTQRQNWVKGARASFFPGEKQNCAICGSFKEICEAHHIIPVSWQYDFRIEKPDQRFLWLCPVHHAAAHSMIDNVVLGRSVDIHGILPTHSEAIDRLVVLPFVEIYSESIIANLSKTDSWLDESGALASVVGEAK